MVTYRAARWRLRNLAPTKSFLIRPAAGNLSNRGVEVKSLDIRRNFHNRDFGLALNRALMEY